MTTQSDIENVLWSACDTFRGKIDSSRYKDYILSMLFVKYLSDVYKETKEKYLRQYEGDMARVERAMRRERFTMSDTSTFDYLYENRNDIQIGEKINKALEQIETNNSAKLHNVFRAIDFNSQVDFGEPKTKNATLRTLLQDFYQLDLRPTQLADNDIIGDAYQYMIAKFASDAGKKGGEFFTPSRVSELVAKLSGTERKRPYLRSDLRQRGAFIEGGRRGAFVQDPDLRTGAERADVGAVQDEYVFAQCRRCGDHERRYACKSAVAGKRPPEKISGRRCQSSVFAG